ncbi:MAG: thioesterase family protein [candidate division KSB1 bacterium]
MHPFTRRYRIRHYELDFLGHLNNANYVRFMQEAAIEASTEAGFSPQWYREHGTGWVIRQLEIRYHAQMHYGEEVEITTWVSDMKRVTSHREYALTRVHDGAQVARARVNWVYLDLKTGAPHRIPEFFREAFQPNNALEELRIHLAKAQAPEAPFHYRSKRRAQTFELDTMQHVHHAAYLSWIEQAYFDAIRAAGHPLESLQPQGWTVVQGGHDIEYFEPARDNDEIEIVSWICELAKVRGAWCHEIYNAHTNKLLARDYALGVFVNDAGKLIVPPQEIVNEVVYGTRLKF